MAACTETDNVCTARENTFVPLYDRDFDLAGSVRSSSPRRSENSVADDSGLFDDYLGPDLLSTDDAVFA